VQGGSRCPRRDDFVGFGEADPPLRVIAAPRSLARERGRTKENTALR